MGKWVSVVALMVMATRAEAGAWYYKWSCAGECANVQGRLAISGVSAGYPTREMCDEDRWNDPRRHEFIRPGNLGGLSFCEEYRSPPAPDDNAGRSESRVPLQRFSLGLAMGGGYQVRDAMTLSTGASTAGADLNFVAGGRPWIGMEMGAGLQFSTVEAPYYGMTPKTLMFVPVTLGFTSSPAIVRGRTVEVRLDLGADLLALFLTGCDECVADDLSTVTLGGQFRGGFDVYFGRTKTMGISIAATMMLGKLGNMDDEFLPSTIEIVPPKFLLRVGFIGRNTDLPW